MKQTTIQRTHFIVGGGSNINSAYLNCKLVLCLYRTYQTDIASLFILGRTETNEYKVGLLDTAKYNIC